LSFILGPWTQILIMLYAPFQSFKVNIVSSSSLFYMDRFLESN